LQDNTILLDTTRAKARLQGKRIQLDKKQIVLTPVNNTSWLNKWKDLLCCQYKWCHLHMRSVHCCLLDSCSLLDMLWQ